MKLLYKDSSRCWWKVEVAMDGQVESDEPEDPDLTWEISLYKEIAGKKDGWFLVCSTIHKGQYDIAPSVSDIAYEIGAMLLEYPIGIARSEFIKE